ncbi:hypothetical protein SOVF_182670 [Spinacia oleracea]|nr:hypothetical protein SOVF_182670 [Spinacia oleracea]
MAMVPPPSSSWRWYLRQSALFSPVYLLRHQSNRSPPLLFLFDGA